MKTEDRLEHERQQLEDEINHGRLGDLRAPFRPEQIGKLPRQTCKACIDGVCNNRNHEKSRCAECNNWIGPHVHIDYVGHAEVTDRLLTADPYWNWEPLAWTPEGLPHIGQNGRQLSLWIRLTVAGVTRLGHGTAFASKAESTKELIGDAIRNAAMRFGVALDQWAKSDLHAQAQADEDEQAGMFSVETITEEDAGRVREMFDEISDEKTRIRVMTDWQRTLPQTVGQTPATELTDLFDSAAAAVKEFTANNGGPAAEAKAALKGKPKLTLADLKRWQAAIIQQNADEDTHEAVTMNHGKVAAVIALAQAMELTPSDIVQRAAEYAEKT